MSECVFYGVTEISRSGSFFIYFERLMGVHIFVFLCPSVSFLDYRPTIGIVRFVMREHNAIN